MEDQWTMNVKAAEMSMEIACSVLKNPINKSTPQGLKATAELMDSVTKSLGLAAGLLRKTSSEMAWAQVPE